MGCVFCFLFVCASSVASPSVAGITSCNRSVLEEKLVNPSVSRGDFSPSALNRALSTTRGSGSVRRNGLLYNPPPDCATEPKAVPVCCDWPNVKPAIPFELALGLGILGCSIPNPNDPRVKGGSAVFNCVCCVWPSKDPGGAAGLEEPSKYSPASAVFGGGSEPNNPVFCD